MDPWDDGGVRPAAPERRARGGPVRVLVVVLVVVVVIVGAFWALQRQLIYFPDTSTVPPAAEVLPGGRDVVLTTSDGLELGAWFFPAPPGSHRDTAVLLAPGNGGNRLGRVSLADQLGRQGFAVLLLDYRGYGGNPGTPSEEGLHADALAAVAALADLGYPPERTIYFGESLGTGVVAALAAERPPAGIVLRSPFTSLGDVGRHHYPFLPVGLLLRDRFEVLEHASRWQVPTVVIRGESDEVVPTKLSAQVAAATPQLVEELVLPGGHNDPVMFGVEVAAAVARLSDELPVPDR